MFNIFEEIGYGIAFAVTGVAAQADIALSSIGINAGTSGWSRCDTAARQEGKKPTNPPEFSNDNHHKQEEPTQESEQKPKKEEQNPEQKPKKEEQNPEQKPKKEQKSKNLDVSGDISADMKNRPVVNNEYNLFNDHPQPNPQPNPQQKPVNPSQQNPIQQGNNAGVAIPTGPIVHSVDMPKKNKPIILDQDPPAVDTDRNTSEILKHMRKLKNEAIKISTSETSIAKAAKDAIAEESTPPTKLVTKFTDNSALFKSYPYLKDIEQIALDNGYQIRFEPRGIGRVQFIICYPSDNDTMKPIDNKAFTIDIGNIIDGRIKIFVGVFYTYENITAYYLFDKDGKINKTFIRNLIVGGNSNIVGGKPIYTKDFIMANSIVDMATIPKNLNKENRKFIQDCIVRLVNKGVLDEILRKDSNTRFAVVQFDPEDKTILLDSSGVPKYFGYGNYTSRERHVVMIYQDLAEIDENGKPQVKAKILNKGDIPGFF